MSCRTCPPTSCGGGPARCETPRTARGSPTRRRCSSRSRCCAATAAATAPSPSRPPVSITRTSQPTQVLAIAAAGRGAGCHEALFTLGEAPEERYPVARRSGSTSTATPPPSTTSWRWPGSSSTRRACSPTPTPVRSTPTSSRRSASVAPSQGMMIESLNAATSAAHADRPTRPRLAGWPRSRPPASSPSRSPPASSWASARPRRTGSTRSRRSPRRHRRHGHVQEVIVQNFLPKPGTAMHRAPRVPRGRLPRRDRAWPD